VSTHGTPDPDPADTPAAPPGDRRRDRRRRKHDGWLDRSVPIILGVGGGLLLAQIVVGVVSAVRGLITVVVISLFLSFAMEPAVKWMHRRGLPRGLGTWVVFLAVIVFFGVFLAAMAPLIADQVTTMLQAGPRLLAQIARQAETLLPGESGAAAAEWLRQLQEGLPAALPEQIGLLGRGALGFGQTVLGGVFLLLTVALVTFYLVADGPRLRLQLASRLSHREQVRVLGLWELAIAKTGGYVYSRALIAVASAAFHVLAFTFIGLEYALALGMWMGIVSSVIPVIGTYLGGALPLLVALAASPGRAILVLVTITLYQQIENYLIMPRITSHAMRLHPAVAFLSVLAGGALAGATGALLALPAVAIATALISASAEEYDVLEHHLLETGPEGAAIVEDHPDHQSYREWTRRRPAPTEDHPGPAP
jgi:predicted PurR-regulated permease PerM